MSRRSRKRSAESGGKWLKVAIGVILAGVLLAGGLFLVVRGFLHSESFRHLLSEKTGKALKASGEFSPLRWDGLAVESDAFTAEGKGRKVRLAGLHTEVGLGGLSRGVWEIAGSRIQQVELELDLRKGAEKEKKPSESKPKIKKSGWLPREIDLKGLDVQDISLTVQTKDGAGSAKGMRLMLEPNNGHNNYQAVVRGGLIHLPFSSFPEIHLEQAKLRGNQDQIFLQSATASARDSTKLTADGEWDREAKQYAFQGNLTDVKCADLFNEDWAKRMTGDMDSDFTVDNPDGPPVARGKLTLRNGTLTALPMLDALAAYADTRRFRVLSLDEAHTEWRWSKEEWSLTNLVLSSEGLIRLEGSLTVRGETLEGRFRLGLAPGTLARIPGAETDVFLTGERGLVWAPLHISGTVDKPREDLTERLIAAAGARMLEALPKTGEKVLELSRSVLGGASPKIVNKGLNVLKEGSEIIEDAGGVDALLDGFLGSKKKKKKKDTPEEPADSSL